MNTGGWYVTLTTTVFADTEGQAQQIAERLAAAQPASEEHAGLAVFDVEPDLETAALSNPFYPAARRRRTQ